MNRLRYFKSNKSRLSFIVIGVTCLLFLSFSTFAQSDTVSSSGEKKIDIKIVKHSPKKAALYSAILPGLGQAYNKKYWKVPVIYVGFGALAYSLNYNQQKFVRYRTAYKYRIDGDPSTVDGYIDKYTDDNLNTLQKYYHRYRDLTVIGMAVLYVLNVVDASVDAHLFTFDVSDDISMNIQPVWINTAAATTNYTTGVGIKIRF